MDNDYSPAFLREFYPMLRCLCHDLFTARARPPTDIPRHPLASLLAPSLPVEDRTTVVHQLMDFRVGAAAGNAPADPARRYGGVLLAADMMPATAPAGGDAPTSRHLESGVDDSEEMDRDLLARVRSLVGPVLSGPSQQL